MTEDFKPERHSERGAMKLREFISYLTNLWGLLSGISIFFPLANRLASALTLPKGYENITTVLSSIVCIFVVFYLYLEADYFDEYQLGRKALTFFGVAIGCLVGFFVFGSGETQNAELIVFQSILQLLAYAGMFASFTGAFTFLAIKYAAEHPRQTPYDDEYLW